MMSIQYQKLKKLPNLKQEIKLNLKKIVVLQISSLVKSTPTNAKSEIIIINFNKMSVIKDKCLNQFKSCLGLLFPSLINPTTDDSSIAKKEDLTTRT